MHTSPSPTTPPPFFLIVGFSQRGKSTIRDLIAEDTGLKAASCSEILYDTWARLSGRSVEELQRIPKETIRHKLRGLGDWLCAEIDYPAHLFPEIAPATVKHFLAEGIQPGHTALVALHIRNGVRALDGIRRPLELASSVERIKSDGFTPVVVWVESTRDMSHVSNDSFCITKEQAQPALVIVNDGLLADVRKDHGPALADLYRRIPSLAPQVETRIPAASGADMDV